MIIVGYIILNFSWTNDIAPVMLNRVSGQSFLNPYDVSELRDFNIFALVVTLFSSVLNRAGWIGNDTSGAGRTPHEQKMAGVLGAWKNGFASMMILLLAVVVITFMTGPRFMHSDNKFKISRTEIRQEHSAKVQDDVVADTAVRAKVMKAIHKIPETFTKQEWDRPLSQQHNLDTPYFNAVRDTLGDTPDARHQFQKYRSLYQQMVMPSVVSKIFPVGMLGLFCLLMVMLLISTDDSRIFNASSTLTQDVILPMFKGHLDQRKHLLLLRLTSVAVELLFLMVSIFFAQLDYINMFITIMCALWLGGAGPIMVFGLYSRFGNLTGAWCSIILGSGTSLLGLRIYP